MRMLHDDAAQWLLFKRAKKDLEQLNFQPRDIIMKTKLFAIIATAGIILLAAAFHTTAKQPPREIELPDIHITSAR